MIQEADVGVGVVGREGLQASRAADYSVAQFRFLNRLMFVHGYLSCHRSAFVALYCFHKSLFIAFIQVLFALYSGFSGASFFNGLSLATYNTFFTALPIFFYSLDRNVSTELLMRYPHLYRESALGAFLNLRSVLYWTLRSLYQSIVVFFGAAFLLAQLHFPPALPIDFPLLSMAVFTICIVVQSATVVLESNSITYLNALAILVTFFGYFASITLASLAPPMGIHGLMLSLFSSPAFWLVSLLITFVALAPFVIDRYWRWNYAPFDYQKLVQLAVPRHRSSKRGEEIRLLPDSPRSGNESPRKDARSVV